MIRNFALSFVASIVLDSIWLGFVMKDFNLRQLAAIGRIENGAFQLSYPPAVVAYVLMALALSLFAIPAAEASDSALQAFGWGAVLGLVVYGIFDMTNLAILKDYPPAFAMVDMAWGTFQFGLITWLVGWQFSKT